MRHVLWIGGPPACGKTTVARRLARRHGLRLYSADTRTWVHRDRALAQGSEAAGRWEALTPAERWEGRTPADLLDMSLHRERGPMVVDDLRALPPAPLVIAEGSVLPAAAAAGDRSRALWLIPTPALQSTRLVAAARTGGRARLEMLLRDVVAQEAADHDMPVLTVDGTATIPETVDAVERAFAGALAAGPRAQTRAERRALLREANEAIVAQFRGYYARPWATGDAEAVLCEFVCECGDVACTVELRLTVAAVAAAPALAPGHG